MPASGVTRPTAATGVRTLLVSGGSSGGSSDSASADQVVSGDGTRVAFDSAASNLLASPMPGGVRQVFSVELGTGARSLVSATATGEPGNGASSSPALSRSGRVVAFTSLSSNLAAGQRNGASNVLVRNGGGPIVLASVGLGGAPANGPSTQPAISADGRYVVFTSTATNLVASEHGPPMARVYIRDLVAGTTGLVSVATDGPAADGPSDSPSISADGRAVSFESAATNLDPRSRHGLVNVYLRTLSPGRPTRGGTQLVSLSSAGVPQNKAAPAGFQQISSVAAGGRFVAFDSDATNLVPGVGTGRSEVYLRDVAAGHTTLVSESSAGYVANNDSFAPEITAGGHFVVFESLATNLAGGGGPRDNVFVRDLHLFTTTVVNVGARGTHVGPEAAGQLLQRPNLSDDALVASFTSSASGLTTKPTGGLANVYVRLLAPPALTRARLSATRGRNPISLSLRADDPHAVLALCRVDHGLYFSCPAGRFTLPRQAPGRHVLQIRAGGPGMLYARRAVSLRFTVLP